MLKDFVTRYHRYNTATSATARSKKTACLDALEPLRDKQLLLALPHAQAVIRMNVDDLHRTRNS